ncbi:hypothetical protein [Streptomyces sp. A012304]|uniref:hypothetical protein n=1 Tax=Streptomyces sp. A012304 TaxID=375446 RepID=UPI002232512C|nr:hypothetical protein [Streptomyces sp. A012304]GKQ37377.1 hypothetical protein ALMP_39150 [Streptomyces sp. A012304]
MSNLAISAPPASTLPEQSVTASLTAEVMNDLETGQPTLVASTHGNQGDLQVVTPAHLLAKVVEQHKQLDRIAALARRWDAQQRKSPGDEMTDRVLTASLERVIAALPSAVAEAMQSALPERYTPELAAQFVEAMTAELRQAQKPEGYPLTAAQRGAEWMLRWGCTPDCINDHNTPNAPEWHAAVRVETAMRDIDSSYSREENAQLPWLAAQVVVTNDKPQAYGRETRVWIDYGTATGELSPAEARQALDAMRGFVAELESVVVHAEESAADDFEGDPEIARLDREADDRRIRAITEARS